MITPEEMAIASFSIEPKLLRYVSMIKWAAESGQIRRRDHDEKNEQARKMTSFSIKGSGIVSGIVGRKARFSISVADVLGMFHLGVDIKGPKNEVYSEQIISLHQSKEIMIGAYQTQPKQGRFASIDNHVMEYMEDGVGNTYVRWKNLKLLGDSSSISVIPFNCQCTGDGAFLMTYLPISTGIHTISIKWQNAHIEGSPFKVKVYQPRDLTRRAIRDAKDKRIIFDSLSLSSIDERPHGLLKIEHEIDLNGRSKNDSEKPTGRSSRSSRMKKQFTVTKRRVIRKVISRHGEEIVIQESPSPTLSRQSSMTDTSTEEELRKSCSPSPPLNRKNIIRSTKSDKEQIIGGDDSNNIQNILEKRSETSDISAKFDTLNINDYKQVEDKKNFKRNRTSPPLAASNLTCRSFSDSMLNYDVSDCNNTKSIRPTKQFKTNFIQSKKLSSKFPSLKVLQSDSLRKSCCYFSSDLLRQNSFSSTSSASSNSNSSLGKVKKPFSLSRSFSVLNNNKYPYNKTLSRLEKIRKDKRYVVDIHIQSERSTTSMASPSTSSLSSLASPSTYSFPFDDLKRNKGMSIIDKTAQSDGQKTCVKEGNDNSQVKGKRSLDHNISKQRATTMYWLNNQTTDHFSVDSTDYDPNFLVEQFILGPSNEQNLIDFSKKESDSQNENLIDNDSSIRRNGSVLPKKTGLQRQFSEMEGTQQTLTTSMGDKLQSVKNNLTTFENHKITSEGGSKPLSKSNPTKFKSIVTVTNIVPSKVHVITPKVNANKSTQVKVNDILQESNFSSLLLDLNIRKRKQYVAIHRKMCTVATKNKGCFKRTRAFSDGELFDKYPINANNNEILHSSRQSTLDSGISEEHSKGDSKGSQTSNNRNILQQKRQNKTSPRKDLYLDPIVQIRKHNKYPHSIGKRHQKISELSFDNLSSSSDTEIFTKRSTQKKNIPCMPQYKQQENVHSKIKTVSSSEIKSSLNDFTKTTEPISIKDQKVSSLNSEKRLSTADMPDIGIGVENTERISLLHDVQSFMQLSPFSKRGAGTETEVKQNDLETKPLPYHPEIVFHTAKAVFLKETPTSHYISALCHYVAPAKTEQMFTNSLSIQLENENIESRDPVCSKFDNVSIEKHSTLRNTDLESDASCTAEGLGLAEGQVGVKNNFQVTFKSRK